MSLENAILELAKAINFHAEVVREVNQPINIQQEAKSNDVSFEAPKAPKKSKKADLIAEIVAGNVVISVDPAKPDSDETVVRYSEPVKAEVKATVTINPNNSDAITSEMCKNLAKEKMGAGVDRTKIKGLVTEMGAESIADLTDRNLVEFYTKLQALK
jgi:hypothetical protein